MPSLLPCRVPSSELRADKLGDIPCSVWSAAVGAGASAVTSPTSKRAQERQKRKDQQRFAMETVKGTGVLDEKERVKPSK